jgi:hypothetical protein
VRNRLLESSATNQSQKALHSSTSFVPLMFIIPMTVGCANLTSIAGLIFSASLLLYEECTRALEAFLRVVKESSDDQSRTTKYILPHQPGQEMADIAQCIMVSLEPNDQTDNRAGYISGHKLSSQSWHVRHVRCRPRFCSPKSDFILGLLSWIAHRRPQFTSRTSCKLTRTGERDTLQRRAPDSCTRSAPGTGHVAGRTS